ncbi:ParM/StbA family protein [Cellvibrio sp. NN19]|uniref:ParM/StbA family protein n=1 Tax=Cellvibrio chitinivorans TaxID=3102792 RepID=UPI002B40A8FB|nr:ParM/StbA family protein [Cellvibrio sp. NN19]
MVKHQFKAKRTLDGLKALAANGYAIFIDDNGYDSHKIISIGADGSVHRFKLNSLVKTGTQNVLRDHDGNIISAYEIGGQLYTCNESLGRDSQSLLDNYQYSNENLALFSHCVQRSKMWDKKLIIATTLPVKRMEVDGNKQKVIAQFKTPVVRAGKSEPLQIASHMVVAEGHAAFYEWAINYDGSVLQEAAEAETILVVDIGGGTIDLVTMTSAGQLNVSVDEARCFTFEGFGLVSLKDELAKLIQFKLKVELPEDYKAAANNISQRTVDAAFDTGFISFPMLNKPIDISEEVSRLKGDWVAKLLRLIVENVDRLDGYNKILIAGGGAVALEQEIDTRLPGCVYLDEYANVNGLAKLMACILINRLKESVLVAEGVS